MVYIIAIAIYYIHIHIHIHIECYYIAYKLQEKITMIDISEGAKKKSRIKSTII